MKTRQETAEFMAEQMSSDYTCELSKYGQWHYGRQELRLLLDFIYEGKPVENGDFLPNRHGLP